MNQRINELIWQCAIPNDQVEDYNRDNNRVEILDQKLDAEKFAELIIRECATVGFDAVANGDPVEDSILEHFGVE